MNSFKVKLAFIIVLVGTGVFFFAVQFESLKGLGLRTYDAPGMDSASEQSVTASTKARPGKKEPPPPPPVDPKVLIPKCNGGHFPSCNALASSYLKENATPKHLQEAERLATLTCEKKDWDGCAVLAEMGMRASDGKSGSPASLRSRTLFKKACDAGFGRGCHLLYKSHRREYRDGFNIDQNVTAAGEALKKTCAATFQMGDQTECKEAYHQLTKELTGPMGGLSSKVKKKVLKSITDVLPPEQSK